MKLEQVTLRSKGWILEEIEDANKPTRVEPEAVEPVLNPMQKEVEKRQEKVKAIIAKRMAASQKAAEETKAPDHCELPKAHEQLCKGRKEVAELVESLKAKGMRFFVKRVDEGDCRYKVFYEEANPIHDLDDEHLEVDGYRIHKTDDGKWVIEDTLEVFDKKEDAVNKAFEYGKHPVNDPMPKAEERKPIDWNETLNEAEEPKKDANDLFSDLLSLIELRLVKYGGEGRKSHSGLSGDDYEGDWGLKDLQDVNLGDIESERFNSADEIVGRIDTYINDYMLHDDEWGDFESVEDALEKSPNHPLHDLLDLIANRIGEVDLNKVAHDDAFESLNEAPDDDGIETDDELDAEEQRARDELERRLQARRAEVARARKARDEKSARRQELMGKAQDKLKAIGDDWSFKHLFDELVPSSGKADTLAGELVRAANKIGYRWFNDGDRFFEDYGIETCGSPALFLMDFSIEDSEGDDSNPFYDMMEEVAIDANGSDIVDKDAEDAYDAFVKALKEKVAEVIKANPTLLAIDDHKDMYSNKYEDVYAKFDRLGMIPTYDFSCDLPRELQAHFDVEDIDSDDLRSEVETWLDNCSGCKYERVDADEQGVTIYGANLAARNEFYDAPGLYGYMEEYARQLDDEFGLPEERLEAEEEERWGSVEEESLDLPEAKPEAKAPEKKGFAKKVVPPGVQMDDDDMDAPMQFNEAEAHAMIGDKPIIEEGRSQIEIANDFSSTSVSGDALAALEADDNI